jgi:hypothetical protein
MLRVQIERHNRDNLNECLVRSARDDRRTLVSKMLPTKLTPVLPPFFGEGEKIRTIEKAVRTVEYGDERRRSVGSMRDTDVAARPLHEVTRSNAPFRIFQRSFEHEGLFERHVLVQWCSRAGRHLEQDGRASLAVFV